ncbi:MAG: 50S ribosomal protein L13 [Candidatus Parcubacteria bacterium]|nr:MAG: 50S ribosomal protein L13 [Candidatus Parcubacteria bacterium]
MKEEIIIDAKNKSLGRLGTEIAYYLQGKHQPDYEPSKDKKIFVLVKNLDQAKFAGKKFDQKVFLKHTGYIGHLKEIPLKLLWSQNKLKVLQTIVSRMLPKNKLRKKRLARIKLIDGD